MLAQTSLRAANTQEGGWDGGQDTEEEDDEGGVAEAQPERERAQDTSWDTANELATTTRRLQHF